MVTHDNGVCEWRGYTMSQSSRPYEETIFRKIMLRAGSGWITDAQVLDIALSYLPLHRAEAILGRWRHPISAGRTYD
jgi:hypothetical protein